MEATPSLTHSAIQELVPLHVVTCPSSYHEFHVEAGASAVSCGTLCCGTASNGRKAVCPCDEFGIPYNDDLIYDQPQGKRISLELLRSGYENVLRVLLLSL